MCCDCGQFVDSKLHNGYAIYHVLTLSEQFFKVKQILNQFMLL